MNLTLPMWYQMEDVSGPCLTLESISDHTHPDSDNLNPPTASTLGGKYEHMRDTVSNTYQNADSYRVFGALCSRALYKRALLEDDPVRIYSHVEDIL